MFLSSCFCRFELYCIHLFLCDNGIFYASTEQVGIAQVGIAQVGTAQVGTDQVGTAQVGMVQVGIAQVGTAQFGTAQVSTFQLNNATRSSVNEVRLMQELKQTFLAVGIKSRENGQCPRPCNIAYFAFWV